MTRVPSRIPPLFFGSIPPSHHPAVLRILYWSRLARVALLRVTSVTCDFSFFIPHPACQNDQILLPPRFFFSRILPSKVLSSRIPPSFLLSSCIPLNLYLALSDEHNGFAHQAEGWFSNRTGTSLDDGARSTNTQIRSDDDCRARGITWILF